MHAHVSVATASLRVGMLSRANLIAKVHSCDGKCVAGRRLPSPEVHASSHRHGSDTSSIELAKFRTRRCSDCRNAEQLYTNCPPHVPRGRTVLDHKGMSLWKQPTGLSPTTSGELYPYPPTSHGEKGNEGLLWRSAENVTMDRLQTAKRRQQDKDLNLIQEVEACFSGSLSLVTEHGDETHISTHDQLSQSTYELGSSSRRAVGGGREETTLAKIWKRKREARRIGGLLLLNGLAAVYGSSNVANKYVAEAAPALPASLSSLVKFTSALIFFIPSLVSALKNRETDLLRAGAELGALAFAASFVDSCNPGGSSSTSPSLLYAFTVVFVAPMELLAGRRSGLKLTRFATLAAAILGMGVLEEEGFGWKGISCPQIGDLWSVAVAIISALHIFRSDALAQKFDSLRLNAVQCGVLAILSLGWEMWTTIGANALQSHELVLSVAALQSIPWVPLLYNGLVCSGLCSWLELRGLRSVHASTATLVYTTIPLWGAFLSSFTSHDVPTDSAIISGVVIAATSIYAQMIISKEEDLSVSRIRSTLESSTNPISTNTIEKQAAAAKENGCFPAGLIVSQLKFPYYAAQAKGLLTEIKLKLGAFKSLGLVFTGISSSTILPTSPPPALVMSTSSAAATPSTTTSGAHGVQLTTSQIGATASQVMDVTSAATVHVPDGVDLASTSANSAAAHGFSSLLTHFSTSISAGFESALAAVSSDLMMATEEAEGVARVVERLVRAGAESAVHAAAGLTAGGKLGLVDITSTVSNSTLQVAANSVETASNSELPGAAVDLQVVNELLMNPAHLTDVLVNGFTHFGDLILPLICN